jgi:DNA-binding XRE family transcriptional regulator
MAIQIIKTEGEAELVVLTRREYEALLTRSGPVAAPPGPSAASRPDVKEALTMGTEGLLPDWFTTALATQQNPIRVARESKGASLAELAQMTGYSEGELGAVEGGSKGPTLAMLDAISHALGVDREWLRALELGRVVES